MMGRVVIIFKEALLKNSMKNDKNFGCKQLIKVDLKKIWI
jgi:hypothetical protein